MAGLNDDVEEGLISLEEETDLTIVDDVLTNQTNPSQPDPDNIIFLNKDTADSVDESTVNITELFGDSLVPGELPNLNAEFELIEQKRNTVNDYEETSKIITGRNSISQEDAKLLNSIVPGFINDNRPLEYFTKNTTRTYFNESIVAMENVINSENNNLDEMLSNHLNNLLQHYSTFNVGFETKLKDILLSQNKTIKQLLENQVVFSTDISDKYFKDNVVLNQFLVTPIDDLVPFEITTDDTMLKILNNIREAFCNNSLRNYLSSFNTTVNGNLISILNNDKYLHSDCSLNKYFNLHLGTTQETLPFDILSKIKSNEDNLSKIRNNFINNNRRLDQVSKESSWMADIMFLTKEFNYINSLSKNLYLLNISIISFLELFKR